MRKNASQSGYTLLMTILLLAMAAVIIAGLCRSSVTSALNAQKSNHDLQSKWGTLSLKKALIQNAPAFFKQNHANYLKQQVDRIASFVIDDQEVITLKDLQQQTLNISLGRLTFQIMIEDEHNKFNVNQLLNADPTHRYARDAINGLLEDTQQDSPVKLTPLSKKQAKDLKISQINTLSQVFQTDQAKNYCPQPNSQSLDPHRANNQNNLGLSQHLTCFGSSKLNYYTAADAVITAQAKHSKYDPLAVQELLTLRQELPHVSFDEQIKKISNSSVSDAKPLKSLFNPKSTCLSMWIITQQKQKKTYDLTIINTTNSGNITTQIFKW